MTLYRIESRTYASLYDDDYRNMSYSYEIVVEAFEVQAETPKGYWIRVYGDKKWVSKTSRKRYAYPTELEAYRAFIARRRCANRIMKARMYENFNFIALAEAKITDK